MTTPQLVVRADSFKMDENLYSSVKIIDIDSDNTLEEFRFLYHVEAGLQMMEVINGKPTQTS